MVTPNPYALRMQALQWNVDPFTGMISQSGQRCIELNAANHRRLVCRFQLGVMDFNTLHKTAMGDARGKRDDEPSKGTS